MNYLKTLSYSIFSACSLFFSQQGVTTYDSSTIQDVPSKNQARNIGPGVYALKGRHADHCNAPWIQNLGWISN